MDQRKAVGSIVVTEAGDLILLTATDVLGDVDALNRIAVFDVGISLRGKLPVCTRGTIKDGEGLRVVSHIGELVRLLEQTGVDLDTPAERPLASLTPAERLERLERENANLRASAAN